MFNSGRRLTLHHICDVNKLLPDSIRPSTTVSSQPTDALNDNCPRPALHWGTQAVLYSLVMTVLPPKGTVLPGSQVTAVFLVLE